MEILEISAAAFYMVCRRSRGNQPPDVQIFAVSLKDIDKALRVKKKIDPRTKLPKQYADFLALFEPANAKALPPH
jgi:hypothetical protein